MSRLDVAIIACDSARTIERTLASVAGLAQRVIVVDSGSRDATIEICRRRGAEVVGHAWEGYGRQKEFALAQCTAEWVLSVDSDEEVDGALAEAIRRTVAADDPALDGAAVNRRAWIGGAELRHTWHPEWLVRLVRRDRARWVGDYHERIEVPGRVARLQGILHHHSVADVAELMRKMVAHGIAAAEVYHAEGRRSSAMRLTASTVSAVVKPLARGAWRDGWLGWAASFASGVHAAAKHARLMELTRGAIDERRANRRVP
jgi:cellulose synthase/poly-beta-1,6-N-acetylglucosamine synthase-like glycosyltransferase